MTSIRSISILVLVTVLATATAALAVTAHVTEGPDSSRWGSMVWGQGKWGQLIFDDGFETGSTERWSAHVP